MKVAQFFHYMFNYKNAADIVPPSLGKLAFGTDNLSWLSSGSVWSSDHKSWRDISLQVTSGSTWLMLQNPIQTKSSSSIINLGFFYQIGIDVQERILWLLLLSGWRRRKQTGVVRLQALRCKDPREVLSWLLDSRLHCIPHHFVRSPQPCWDNCFYSSLVSVWPEAALLAVED